MNLFVVDDEPLLRMIIIDHLEQADRSIQEFESGLELLAAMDQAPDLVLLDIEMPGMDGISACRAWRDAGHEDTQILFVSSHDDLETRLAAYDAGGNDFIVKPVEMVELQRKVRVAEAAIRKRRALAEQASYAGQTAFTALSTIGEMGVIQQFMRASFAATTVDQVAAALFEALEQYGLPGLIEVRLAGEPRRFAPNGGCTPLEASLLGHAEKMGRIFQFRDRIAINYPAVTLMLKSLPLDDLDRAGRLRDHLAILVEGANTRLLALETERDEAAQRQGISQALSDLAATLETIERFQEESQRRGAEIDAHYLNEMVGLFIQLDLPEEEENLLADMVQRTHCELLALRDKSLSVSDQLHEVVGRLRLLLRD